MNRYKKLLSDTVILAFGTFGSKLLVFLLMPLYTALLSPAEYSAAELITGTANLIMPFACIGITNGIFRFAADRFCEKREIFSSGIALVGVGFAITLAVGLPLLLLEQIRVETALILAYVLLADLQAVCAQYVRAIDRTRLFALQGILNTLITIGANLLFLIVFQWGTVGYVVAVIVGNLVTTLFLVWRARLWRDFRVSFIKATALWELLRYSLPMVPTTICWLITDLSDRYFVNAIHGAAANGIYSAAYKIPTVVNLLSGIFLQAWQFSAVTQAADDEDCKSFYSEIFRSFLALIFLGTAGLLLCSELLCGLLLDEAYAGAAHYMPTLLIAVALEAVVSFLATVYMLSKKSMHSFVTAISGTAANLLLNFLLIPRIGVLGAAIATAISYGVVYVLRSLDVPRLLRFRMEIPRQLLNYFLLILLAVVMTAEPKGKYIIAPVLTALVCILNLPILLSNVKALLRRRKRT